jgi:hypothetical protein
MLPEFGNSDMKDRDWSKVNCPTYQVVESEGF